MLADATSGAGALTGQVALVTGGGRGIGRALAHDLAMAGAAVAVVARSIEQLTDTVASIEHAGGRALALAADVTDRQAIDEVVHEVARQFGPVDLLVNNAGIVSPLGPVWEVDPEEWWRSMAINVYGPLLCAVAVLPSMIQRRRGRIVNVASGAGLQSIAYGSAYVVSKTALIRLSENLAVETREHGISVFAIHPGAVQTAMAEYLADSDAGRRWTPWFRQAFVEDGTYDSLESALQLVRVLASGQADSLSGCFLTAGEDWVALVGKAEEIQRRASYTLRLREGGV